VLMQVWVDHNVGRMLDSTSSDLVRRKLINFSGLLSQAAEEKEYAWHRLTVDQILVEERTIAERLFVEAQNKFDRHSTSIRMCTPLHCCTFHEFTPTTTALSGLFAGDES
jgi:hypothetical protein